MKKSFTVIIFFCLFAACCFGLEGLRFENITNKEGLSQNTVRDIMQDSKGFMWFGTMNGLNRYDGKEFIVMKPKTGSFISLPDNRIWSIAEDKNGFLWIKTYSNMISCYDPRKEQFVNCENPLIEFKNCENFLIASNGDVWLWGKQIGFCRIKYENNQFKGDLFTEKLENGELVNCMYESFDKTIWIGTEKGVLRMSEGKIINCNIGGKFFNIQSVIEDDSKMCFFSSSNQIILFDKKDKTYLFNIKITNNNDNLKINNAAILKSGQILITANKGIYLYDSHKNIIQPAEVLFNHQLLYNAFIIQDNKHNLWIYNRSGNIWQHNKETNTFKPINLIPSAQLALIDYERFAIYHDSRNIIWITTYGNGLFALDQNTGQTSHFLAGINQSNGLYTNYLLCIKEDKSGEIWVGSEYSGICKISLANYDTKVLFPEPKTNHTNNSIRMIYDDNKSGEIWIGSRRGKIYVYDEDFKINRSYDIPEGMPYALAEDSSGNKWIGTKGNGLLIFPTGDKHGYKTYISQSNNPNTLANDNLYAVIRDTKGRMWIGTFGGGLHLAEKKGEEIVFQKFLNVSYNQSVIRTIMQDKNGLIWAGTNDGVCAFYPDELIADKTNYITFHFDNKDDTSINSNEIKVIYEDSQGRIWFGTSGGGLNLLIRETPLDSSRFKHYTSHNGLSNDVVQAIVEDDQGFLWISTESGISKFSPETEKFEIFNFSDIRQANLFCEASCWKRKNGDLMFGSYYGMYIFNPQEFMNSSYAPPVMITNLKINGNNVRPGDKDSPLKESISLTRKITLQYNQNSFNIEFSTLNFHESTSNQYTYILDGYEKDWNPITKYNVATYRNIPPGKYKFKVKGSNSFGVWNEQETTLEMTVIPPLWKSSQALACYLLLFLIIAFFAAKLILQMNKLHNAVEVEKQLSEYKIRFFTNISHEFRTPLTIIRGSVDNLTSRKDLPEAIDKQVRLLDKSSGRLMRLIDQLLEFRRLQNNKMELNLEKTEVVSFFQDIYKMFTETAEKKKIEFVFESNQSKYEMLLDKSKMDKVVFNLLSNAFKYTPENGKIVMNVHFDIPSDRFYLSVSDNGVGIPEDQRDMLFTRFKQINYTTSSTGVGLHLTSELIAVHKGEIKFTDSEIGGACFTVSIPISDKNYEEEKIVRPIRNEQIVDTPKLHQTIELGDVMEPKSLKNYKLLIIEDDEEVREFLKDQLGEYFSVITAENGLIGLNKAREEQPDLVVCDVMMPEMDGFQVTNKLKTDFETSHMPIIILTAHSSDEHQLEGIQSGADAYITKPFNMKYLMMRIVKLIDQRERLQQKFSKTPGVVQPTITSSDKDKDIINKLHKIIEENLGNANFTIDEFAQSIGFGRTIFFKKIKALTGYTPNEYLRILRLKKAAELLKTTNLNVAEVSYKVGIDDPFYFSKCFKAQFGQAPSFYQKEGQGENA